MKKIISLTMILIMTTASIFMLSGCINMKGKEVYEEGYFLYTVWKADEISDVDYVRIENLSESGKEQTTLIVPEALGGYPVKYLCYQSGLWGHRGQWESDNLEKVFIPFEINSEEETFSYCNNLKKIIILKIEPSYTSSYNFFLKNYYCSFNYDVVDKTNKDSEYAYYANISFMYNYEGAENEGYYWIDDLDYESKIDLIPEEPEREGYIFEGWYKEEGCINKWDFNNDTLSQKQTNEEGDVIYQETKLYAKWI
jgi:uncharacterized repeat protein (TIGR02543 family)